MPQFDLSSFFIQYFWLFISLIITHLLLCFYFLPATSKYIKSRRQIPHTTKVKGKVFTYLPVTLIDIKTKEISLKLKGVIF
jgi:hypothetical protein